MQFARKLLDCLWKFIIISMIAKMGRHEDWKPKNNYVSILKKPKKLWKLHMRSIKVHLTAQLLILLVVSSEVRLHVYEAYGAEKVSTTLLQSSGYKSVISACTVSYLQGTGVTVIMKAVLPGLGSSLHSRRLIPACSPDLGCTVWNFWRSGWLALARWLALKKQI